MKPHDVRGYVVALSLAGFTAAWAAAAGEVRPTAPDADAARTLAEQSQMLSQREAQLDIARRDARRIIEQRRADARKPRPVRYVTVVGGGGASRSASGGSSNTSRGASAPAPVRIAPVTSSGSS